jgi:hypothetical protein
MFEFKNVNKLTCTGRLETMADRFLKRTSPFVGLKHCEM